MNDLEIGVLIGLGYMISVFIFQLGMIFLIQWNAQRRKQAGNVIILSYGLYFISFAISHFISTYYKFHFLSIELFSLLIITVILVRGVGGLIFYINLEHAFRKSFKTHYTITLTFTISVVMALIPWPTPMNLVTLNVFHALFLSPCISSTIYFTFNTFGEIKQKLKVALLGILLFYTGLFFSSGNRYIVIQAYFSFPYYILLSSQILTFIGIFLMFFGFRGNTFSLELQWVKNLVSVHVIDKVRNIGLYHKDFLEAEIKSEDLFTGGISGMIRMLNEITESKENIDVINLEKHLILIENGEKIIVAMVTKKNLLNARYVLKEITSKFETYFKDYLEEYDVAEIMKSRSEFFQPTEMIIKNLITIET
ncbi:MAG: hypothetical protein ACTSRB_13205 [Candidatus Helarchaeota archaeon]